MITQEIKIKIHEEADLFSSFDPDQKLLSEEVTFYFERNYLNKHRSSRENYILHIISDTPLNEESVKERIIEYFTQEDDNLTFARRKLTVKQIYLAVIGVIILVIWFFASMKSDGESHVNLEILSIMGWVAIWEATSIAIIQRPEITILKKNYARIINSRIIFEYSPSDENGTANGSNQN